MRLILFAALCLLSACSSYTVGSAERKVPGGYRQVAVPIFKNVTMEPGIEVSFTNAMIRELARSKVASVTDKEHAEVIIEGQIDSIQYSPESRRAFSGFREEVTIASQYTILLEATVSVRRAADREIIWTGQFKGKKPYFAPQVSEPGLSSVNPLYNLSARRQNISLMAAEMMSEAYDRITENF